MWLQKGKKWAIWGSEQRMGNLGFRRARNEKFGVRKSKKWAILGLGRLKMGNLGFIGVENENLGSQEGQNGGFGPPRPSLWSLPSAQSGSSGRVRK